MRESIKTQHALKTLPILLLRSMVRGKNRIGHVLAQLDFSLGGVLVRYVYRELYSLNKIIKQHLKDKYGLDISIYTGPSAVSLQKSNSSGVSASYFAIADEIIIRTSNISAQNIHSTLDRVLASLVHEMLHRASYKEIKLSDNTLRPIPKFTRCGLSCRYTSNSENDNNQKKRLLDGINEAITERLTREVLLSYYPGFNNFGGVYAKELSILDNILDEVAKGINTDKEYVWRNMLDIYFNGWSSVNRNFKKALLKALKGHNFIN